MVTAEIQRELESLADPGHAAILQRFFKTGPENMARATGSGAFASRS